MTPQAAGQLLVIVSFAVWALVWMGLAFTGCLAAHWRQPWAATFASTASVGTFAAGVYVLSALPGSMQ